MSILISGSLVYDHIMNFPDSFKNHILPDQIHILNVCFMIDRLEKSWGGTAGNIAHTVKLLGGEPIIISAVGKDGKEYVQHFKDLSIETKYIKVVSDMATASAYITTDNEDNQITAFFGGPLNQAGEVTMNESKGTSKLLLVSPTHKDVMMKHLKEGRENKMEVVFDPGQQMTAFNQIELRKMIGQSDFVAGNDYEIKLLEERTGWSAKEILQYAKVLITTLGERGSIISTREGEVIEVKACPPQSFDDPTGAGEAYRAGFFVAYEKNLPLKTCAQVGSVAASYAIETYGTQEHRFSLAEFSDRYEKTYGEKLNLY